MLSFSANISTMFHEVPFMRRFEEAEKFGFKYVEIQSPYIYDCQELAKARSGLKCSLFNSFEGQDFGTASVPGKEVEFLTDLHKITPYYNALDTKRVHILAGLRDENFEFEDQLHYYRENLCSAVSYLENQDLVGVIEPICPAVKENYFLSSFETAVEVIKYVNSDHIKLLLDIYHLHMITGDVKKYLEEYFPYAGHIQISQDPGRHEPFYPGGKIDYDYIFRFLKEKNYSEPIGLEYYPSSSTVDSLEWMKRFGN